MATPTATRTLGDVFSFVKRQFGDESGVQITDTDITRWVNQAQNEIVNKNPMIQATAEGLSVQGTQTIDLNTIAPNLLQLEAVIYDGWPLEPTSLERLKADIGGPDAATQGTPQYFYVWGNKIYMWPVPSTSSKSIQVNYSAHPSSVSGAADTLGVPDRYYERVCEYVMSKAYELDEDWQGHQVNKQAFEDKLTEVREGDKTQIGAFPVVYDAEYE